MKQINDLLLLFVTWNGKFLSLGNFLQSLEDFAGSEQQHESLKLPIQKGFISGNLFSNQLFCFLSQHNQNHFLNKSNFEIENMDWVFLGFYYVKFGKKLTMSPERLQVSETDISAEKTFENSA